MKQKIKSLISLKATSTFFSLLFFVALAGGVVIDAPNASAATPVISGLTVTPNSGTVKVGSAVVLTITADASGYFENAITVNSVATTGFTDNSDNTYSATYTVVEGNSDVSSGVITASVVLTDSGGINPNTAYTTVTANTLVVDANSPTLTSAEFTDDALKVGETSLVTFTFSEAISDFTNDDLTIANGTLTAVTDAGAGTIWTATFTPTDDLEEAINVITVDMTGVADTATNAGVGSTDSSNYAIDTTAPVDGELKAEDGIVLIDTDTGTGGNGKIDKVQISVNYAVATADAIAHATDEDTTKGKFTITDIGTAVSVDIDSISFVSGDGTIAIFELVLDETYVTSATELNVSYDADGSNLKIISGTSESVDVASFSNIEEEDSDLPDGGTLKPEQPNPNSGVTLYRIDGSPRVYVIKNKKKHWIQTPKEFNDNGYNWGKVKVVSAEVLEEYSDEEEVSTTELLRAIGSNKVYKVNNGKRRWIETAGEFNAAGYKWKDIKDVSSETLASYQNEVLSELLRATGSHKVYIIENGKRRWIKTAGEFNAAGHRWEDVEDVSVAALDSYSDSE